MNLITFGIPTQTRTIKEVVEEKYPDLAVLTMQAKPDVPKARTKFELNSKAVELLELDLKEDNYISFGFELPKEDSEGSIFIAVTTNVDVPKAKITRQGSFSDGKSHDYISSNFGHLEGEFEVSFHTTQDNVKIYKLSLIEVAVEEEGVIVETL